MATQYRQSGVVYRASGVAYGTLTTITPATIAATATIPTDFEFEYRQSGQAYRNSYDYRQALISGNAYLVVATPATIGVTTSITATGGIPITVSVSTIAAVAAVPAVDIDANYIHVDAGIAAICAVPAPTVITGALMTPATIAGVAALPAPTGEVTVIANHVSGTGAVPDPTREWHVLPGTITCTTTMGEDPVYTLLEMPFTMTLPPSRGTGGSEPFGVWVATALRNGEKGNEPDNYQQHFHSDVPPLRLEHCDKMDIWGTCVPNGFYVHRNSVTNCRRILD